MLLETNSLLSLDSDFIQSRAESYAWSTPLSPEAGVGKVYAIAEQLRT